MPSESLPGLRVLTVPDPRLRGVATTISVFDQRLHDQARAMLRTMRSRNGAGLAAPQVGRIQRMFVLEEDPQLGYMQVVCNPQVAYASTRTSIESEGCLSIPGLFIGVERPESLTLLAQDLYGAHHEFRVSGFTARVVQHELDHLDGVLMVDRVIAEHRERAEEAMRQLGDRP